MKIRAYTDHAFTQFGDKGQRGPIREVTITQFDGGNSADVLFRGATVSVKVSQLYIRPRGVDDAALKPILKEPVKAKGPPKIVDSAYMRIKNSRPDAPNSAYQRIKNGGMDL